MRFKNCKNLFFWILLASTAGSWFCIRVDAAESPNHDLASMGRTHSFSTSPKEELPPQHWVLGNGYGARNFFKSSLGYESPFKSPQPAVPNSKIASLTSTQVTYQPCQVLEQDTINFLCKHSSQPQSLDF